MQKINKGLLVMILIEIKVNSQITEKELAKKYYYTERSIRRYIKILKDDGKIKLVKVGKKRSWEIIGWIILFE